MQDTVTTIIDQPQRIEGIPKIAWDTSNSKITEQIQREDRIIVTENDHPVAIMLKVDDSNLSDTVRDLGRVRALRALKEAQTSAAMSGVTMTLDEINATISATRAERKARGKAR